MGSNRNRAGKGALRMSDRGFDARNASNVPMMFSLPACSVAASQSEDFQLHDRPMAA
jgi:hypothetical protein